MILYKDDPSLDLPTVTTIGNDVEYRYNCRCMYGKYYVIDRDCFLVNGIWCRVDSGRILYDHETQKWVHKNNCGNLVRGVVDFAKGEPIMGYFTPNIYENVVSRTRSHGIHTAINSALLEKNYFFEDPAISTWFYAKDMSTPDIRTRKSIRNERNFTDRGYNIEDNIADYKYKVESYNAYPLPISRKAKEMAKYLGDLTFGAEIEVAVGNIPIHLQNRHGVVICRDGSIDGGPELVTIPLSGAKGLQNIVKLCAELRDRTRMSLACAFHIHFGNVPKDRLFIAAFYVLCRKIQDELFTMFPYYKTDHNGVKKKNYNKKLDKLGIHPLVNKDKESYELYLRDVNSRIFNFLSEGRVDEVDRRSREHPIRAKWERKNRYYWANLMNMFFTTRHTVEFRLHGPTANAHKIVNWMFICVAIIKYAETYSMDILTGKGPISMKDVLHVFVDIFPRDQKACFISDYLYAYFESRQSAFKKDLAGGDVISVWDINDDHLYSFELNGVKGLI